MTDTANPLVAGRVDSTEWYSGIGIAESIADTVAGIGSGSWIDSTIGGVSGSLEALGLVIDPLGSVVSWGVAWLMEHVKPLSDALDWLAGDPDQITAYAQTWRNVAGNSTQAAADLRAAVHQQVAGWTGAAADAYRAHAGQQLAALDGIARAADGLGSLVEGAGLLVALVRELVRDLIADFVSVLAVRLPMWLAEAGLTLGLATPLVVSQVGALVAKWAAKIAKLVLALVNSLRRLAPLLKRLGGLIGDLQDLLRRLSRHDATSPSGGTPGVDGDGTPGGPDPAGDGDRRYDDVDGDGRPDIPPPFSGGPPLPTKPMDDHYRYETDPNDPRNPFRPNAVQRLTDEAREMRRVVVAPDGRLYTASGELFDTHGSQTHWGGPNSDRAIFVMDEQGNLYASKYQEAQKFHHSTLSGGEPVAGAGEIRVENGRLTGLTDQSGHYRPDRSMTQRVVDTLTAQGADTTDLKVVMLAPEGT